MEFFLEYLLKNILKTNFLHDDQSIKFLSMANQIEFFISLYYSTFNI
jgi:hypothetical protein